MSLVILQCFRETCKFYKSVKWIVAEESLEGVTVCSEYPETIPSFVEDGIQDCSKFQSEER